MVRRIQQQRVGECEFGNRQQSFGRSRQSDQQEEIRAAPVPNSVPTPCIEALLTVTRHSVETRCKCLITSSNGQQSIMLVPASKLLILGRLLIRNQQVAGSIPAGGSSLSRHLRCHCGRINAISTGIFTGTACEISPWDGEKVDHSQPGWAMYYPFGGFRRLAFHGPVLGYSVDALPA